MAGLGAAAMTAPLLGGCGWKSVTRRFRVIATAEVDGKTVEGSTVMEITYSRITKSLIGAGGSTSLKGEALILDLPGKGTVYVLPVFENNNGSLAQVYENGVLRSLGIPDSIGMMRDEAFDTLRQAKGRMPFKGPTIDFRQRLPLFAAFIDEKAPKTIFEIDPWNMGARFPGVKLVSFDIEFTNAPVTKALTGRLPWLLEPGPHFNSDPPGQHRPVYEQPLSYKISRQKFFGIGS